MLVARSSPPAKRSASSAADCIWSAVNAAAQSDGANIGKPVLLLCVNSDVVAINIVWGMLFDRRIELETRCAPAIRRENARRSIHDARKETSNERARDVRGAHRSHGRVLQSPSRREAPDSTGRMHSDGHRGKAPLERPPATRSENPTSGVPPTRRVMAVRPMSLISGYEHHEWQPAIEILNLRGRL